MSHAHECHNAMQNCSDEVQGRLGFMVTKLQAATCCFYQGATTELVSKLIHYMHVCKTTIIHSPPLTQKS